MTTVSIYNRFNRPRKRDGDEFARESKGFLKCHGGNGISISAPLAAHARRVSLHLALMEECRNNGKIDLLGVFCHGWKTGLQTGHSIASAGELADTLCEVCTTDVRIFFAACSAGVAFLPRLHELMQHRGMSPNIWGHTTSGHTTRNPNIIRLSEFEPEELSDAYKRIVKRALDTSTDLRFRIPLADSMSQLVDWAEV